MKPSIIQNGMIQPIPDPVLSLRDLGTSRTGSYMNEFLSSLLSLFHFHLFFCAIFLIRALYREKAKPVSGVSWIHDRQTYGARQVQS